MKKFIFSVFIATSLIVLGYCFCRINGLEYHGYLYVGFFVGGAWQFIRNNIID